MPGGCRGSTRRDASSRKQAIPCRSPGRCRRAASPALFDELALDDHGAADAPEPADGQPAGRVEVAVTTQPYRTVRDAALARIERRYFEQMLEVHENNLTAVARAAGVDRMTVYRMLDRCGLRRSTDED